MDTGNIYGYLKFHGNEYIAKDNPKGLGYGDGITVYAIVRLGKISYPEFYEIVSNRNYNDSSSLFGTQYQYDGNTAFSVGGATTAVGVLTHHDNEGKWAKIAGTYDKNTGIISIYAGDYSKSRDIGSVTFNTGVSPLFIGRAWLSGRGYKGDIALVAIFNEAKSKGWIDSLFDNWMSSKNVRNYIDDTCALWLDGGSIDTANGVWRDFSKYHNDGTIYGAVEVSNIGVI